MRRFKRLALVIAHSLLLGLASRGCFSPEVACAQQGLGVQGGTDNNKTFVKVGGDDGNSKMWVLQVDENGILKSVEQNPDRNFWALKSSNVLAWTPAGAGAILQTGSPVDLKGYTQAMLNVSYAAADSDSVALDIYLVGRVSNNADALYYLIDTDPSTSKIDGFLVTKAYTTLGAASASGYVIQTKSIPVGGGFTAAGPVTTTQVAIPVSYKNGAPIPLPMLCHLWVINRRVTNATPTHGAVTIDWWVKR